MNKKKLYLAAAFFSVLSSQFLFPHAVSAQYAFQSDWNQFVFVNSYDSTSVSVTGSCRFLSAYLGLYRDYSGGDPELFVGPGILTTTSNSFWFNFWYGFWAGAPYSTLDCTNGFSLNLGSVTPGWHMLTVFELTSGSVIDGDTTTPAWAIYKKIPFFVCVANINQVCYSAPTNSCGDASPGYVQCDGSCTATAAPAERAYWHQSCQSYPNACNQTTSGITDCNGSCSASAPSLPANYGTTCTSAANACGGTTAGVTGCDSTCSAAVPPNPAGYGSACSLTSAANACGQTTSVAGAGTQSCSGTCTGTPPAAPPVTVPGYGSTCTLTSASNACGMTTTSTGTLGCSGTCTSTTPPQTPSNSACTPPPAPTVSGAYQSNPVTGATTLIPSPAAFNPTGYQFFAEATSPYASNPAINSNLTYYFEWSTDGVTWSPLGTWANVPKQ